MIQFFPVYILAAAYYVLGIVAYITIYIQNSPQNTRKDGALTYLNVTPMNVLRETSIDMDLEYAAN